MYIPDTWLKHVASYSDICIYKYYAARARVATTAKGLSSMFRTGRGGARYNSLRVPNTIAECCNGNALLLSTFRLSCCASGRIASKAPSPGGALAGACLCRGERDRHMSWCPPQEMVRMLAEAQYHVWPG